MHEIEDNPSNQPAHRGKHARRVSMNDERPRVLGQTLIQRQQRNEPEATPLHTCESKQTTTLRTHWTPPWSPAAMVSFV